jgi:glycosyltransferase involved in cell wall biosynthesis
MKNIKNIGILHYQVGHTDGVSLEISKWRLVLEKMGFQVHLCAGDLGADAGYLIHDLYHHGEDIKRIDRNAFGALDEFNAGELFNEIEKVSARLEAGLRTFIKTNAIDVLIVNNIWSVALNLPAAIALQRVCANLALPVIGHHHDFYWERRGGVVPTCQPVAQILENYFPPQDDWIKHVVINSLAQQALTDRKELVSEVIPNVFDFDAPAWSVDGYNQDLRARIGLRDTDVLVLQATRVIPRKAIELAIQFVKALNAPARRDELMRLGLYNGQSFIEDSRVVLVVTGYARDDMPGNYFRLLEKKARDENVDLRHVEELIAYSRHNHIAEKKYSFWDAYAVADLVTYPSLWEGWGNQLLEAVQARLPVILFEYPVYTADIKEKGFDFISLGSQIESYDLDGLAVVNEEIIAQAADQAVHVLTDRKQRTQMVQHNHQVCQQHYSLHALEDMLQDLLTSL